MAKRREFDVNPASAELIEQYVANLDRRGLKRATSLDRARRALTPFAEVLGDKPITEATADEIDAWLDTRELGANSRRWYLANLSSFYSWCVKRGHAERNPVDRIDRPRGRRGVPRPISDRDLENALANAEPRMRVWLCLAAYAGLRCQEIAGVRRQDVRDDLEPPMLIVVDGKGGKERAVPLHPILLEALRAYGMSEEGYLWTGRGGPLSGTVPLTARWVTLAISAYLRSIDVNATAHQLRHWFATNVFRDSKDIRMTQEMMGHAQPTTTAIYVAFDPGEAVPVVQGLSTARARSAVARRRVDNELVERDEMVERYQAMLRPMPRPQTLRSFLDGGGDLASLPFVRGVCESVVSHYLGQSEQQRARWAAILQTMAENWLAGRLAYIDQVCLEGGEAPDPPTAEDMMATLWEAELLEDPSLYERFRDLAPADVVEDQMQLYEAIEDQRRRPWRLDVARAPTHCGACGEEREDENVLVVVNRGWEDEGEEPKCFLCRDCIGEATRRMELASV